jgi:hypothetical protein
MSVNLERIHRFLDIATRPTTIPGEAQAALTKLRDALDRAGLTVHDLVVGQAQAQPQEPRRTKADRAKDEKIEALIWQVQELSAEIKTWETAYFREEESWRNDRQRLTAALEAEMHKAKAWETTAQTQMTLMRDIFERLAGSGVVEPQNDTPKASLKAFRWKLRKSYTTAQAAEARARLSDALNRGEISPSSHRAYCAHVTRRTTKYV